MADLLSSLANSDHKFIVHTLRDPLAQSFAIELLLQQHAKESRSVLLILLNQNWQHYSAVATKCGVNTQKLLADNILQVLDIFDQSSLDVTSFQAKAIELLTKLSANSVVLVDDISVLFSFNQTQNQVYSFVRSLRRLAYGNKCKLFVGSKYTESDEQVQTCVNRLLYESDAWLDCDKPQTGYSQQINGIAKYTNQVDHLTSEYNYKIVNRNVTFKKLV